LKCDKPRGAEDIIVQPLIDRVSNLEAQAGALSIRLSSSATLVFSNSHARADC
jgi:hypothetical protein